MERRSRTAALSLGASVIYRQLRSQPAVVITILVATALGAFLVGAAPRSLERAAREDLRATVVDPAPAMRDIRVERRDHIRPGPADDPLANVRMVGEGFARSQFPDSVTGIISAQNTVVDTGRFHVLPIPGEPPPHPFDMFLRFRFQEGVEDRLALVAGRPPQSQESVEVLVGGDCPEDPEQRQRLIDRLESGATSTEEPVDCELEDVPHFQVMVTEATRQALGLELGQLMLLSPDRVDPFYFGLDSRDLDFLWVMSISGVIELDDLSDEFWFGDESLHTPRIQQNADLRIIYATGLASDTDFEAMVTALSHVHRLHTWRYLVSPDLVSEADVDLLEADLEALQARFPGAGARSHDSVVITRLPDLLEAHQRQSEQTTAILSTGLAGLLATVATVVLVLTLLMTERQLGGLVLIRGRGASGGQLTLTRLYEALVLIIPASAVGYLAGALAAPGTVSSGAYRATVALATAAALAVVAATVPVARRNLGDLLRRRGRSRIELPPQRLVIDLGLVALASGAVVLLRRRGDIEGPAGSDTGLDLLLAAAPVLVAAAAGLLAVRLHPRAVHFMAWLGARSRGVVGLVGLRRILQQTPGERLPMVVIVICVATAAFSIVGRTTIAQGQIAHSWQSVGADYSIRGFGQNAALPAAVDLDEYDVVEEMALSAVFDDARAVFGVFSVPTEVIAVDSAAHTRVTAGTPADQGFPAGFGQAKPGIGSGAAPIPVIVSGFWPSDLEPSPEDVFVLDLGRAQPTVIVGEVRDRYPGLDPGGPFVVIDLTLLQQYGDLPIQPTIVQFRAPESAGAEIRQTLAGQSSLGMLTSRYEVLDGLAEDPFVAWVDTAMALVFVFSLILAGVTAVSALALGAAVRSRDLAYLRTMGLLRRQALAMTAIEQFPSLLGATLVGVVAGAVTGILLEPAIDFSPFSGGLLPVEIQVDWAVVAAGSVALSALLAAAVGIFLVAFGDDELAPTLRLGEEQ